MPDSARPPWLGTVTPNEYPDLPHRPISGLPMDSTDVVEVDEVDDEIESLARMLAGAATLNGAPAWHELSDAEKDEYRSEASALFGRR